MSLIKENKITGFEERSIPQTCFFIKRFTQKKYRFFIGDIPSSLINLFLWKSNNIKHNSSIFSSAHQIMS